MTFRASQRRRLVAALAFAFWAVNAHALPYSDQPDQYVRQQWTVGSGFPGGPVRTIRQLSDGYLWLGTQKGLIRFDGIHFLLSTPPDPTFQSDQISDLMRGPDGKLWVVFWGAGLLRYNDGQLQNLPSKFGQPGIQVTASLRARNDAILLADSVNGIERISADGTQTLAPASSLPGYALVISMAESSDGTIWLGTASQGLFRLKDKHIQTVFPGTVTKRINCLLPTGENSLLIGAGNGLFKWDGNRLSRVPLPKEAEGAQVLTMLRDRTSNLWIGTTAGLVRIDARGASLFESDAFASGDGVTALLEDREGNVWVGGSLGLERISEKSFVTYTQADGLPREVNGPVHVDEGGRTWVAPQRGGVDLIIGGAVQHLQSELLDRNVIYSIASKGNDLWMGTQSGGLIRVTLKTGIVATTTYTHADGLPENSVFSLSVGPDGAVWAGTLTGGVSQIKDGKFVNYTRDDGLASNTVSAILETRDHILWFATPNGLTSLLNHRWSTYTTRDGLPSNNVNCLFEDKSGSLWIGTSAGLSIFEHGRITTLSDLPSSLQDQVFGFAQDRAGRLWVETATHILRIRSTSSSGGAASSLEVREYDTEDGLPRIEGVRRSNPVATGTDGKIWFSLRQGVTLVDSGRVQDDSVPALAHIDEISADGNTIPTAGPVRIPPSRKRITIQYTGISLTVPERVRFRYLLEGFDRVWSAPTDAREAVYTNLSPGLYRFRLVSSNSDGLWNGPDTSVVFKVEPAFWQTLWFRTAVAAIVVLALWMSFRIRTHQLTSQLNLRFQERLAERNRIARELHDTLLQSMQGLMLRFQTVCDMLPAHPEEAKQALKSSLEKADLAIVEGRNAIMDLRSDARADFDLANALRSLATEPNGLSSLGRKRGDFCVVWVDGVPRNVRLDVRDDISRIAREALHNAIQHAMAQQIRVKITYRKDELRVEVLDNGKGMEPSVLEQGERTGHWGLVGMRERALRIGAMLEIDSRPGEGTNVSLRVPGNRAYETSRNPRWPTFH